MSLFGFLEEKQYIRRGSSRKSLFRIGHVRTQSLTTVQDMAIAHQYSVEIVSKTKWWVCEDPLALTNFKVVCHDLIREVWASHCLLCSVHRDDLILLSSGGEESAQEAEPFSLPLFCYDVEKERSSIQKSQVPQEAVEFGKYVLGSLSFFLIKS